MNAAVLTVGDELLAGRTTNTNATWLCTRLGDRGVSVERVTTVPDRIEDIARTVEEYRQAYDAVVVTGGLGPTHDDVTMAAVASALERDLEEHADALVDGRVSLTSRRGSVRARVDRDEGIPCGMVWLPIHHPATNRLTLPDRDPQSKEPHFKQCAVRLDRSEPI